MSRPPFRASPPSRPIAAAAVAAAAIACSLPSDACGCPPARSWVFVVGTLADAAGAPVAGARLYLDGFSFAQSPTFPVSVGSVPDAQTDAAGAFRATAYTPFPPSVLELRVAVTRPGSADTVRLSAGTARFRWDREQPDTVRVALRLP